jgi:hypothetical protein
MIQGYRPQSRPRITTKERVIQGGHNVATIERFGGAPVRGIARSIAYNARQSERRLRAAGVSRRAPLRSMVRRKMR